MLFTTWVFWAFFLAVIFGVWLLPSRVSRQLFLLLASMVFYAHWKASYLLIIVAPAVADYYIGTWIEDSPLKRNKRLWLLASIFLNLGLLAYFKYCNFFLSSFVQLSGIAD